MLEKNIQRHIDTLTQRYPALEVNSKDIAEAYLILEESYQNGGKLLIAGMVVQQRMQSILLVSL